MSGATLAVALALWVQGLIVFAIAAVLYQRRVPRVLRGEINARDVALESSAWPDDAKKASNAFSNQFELPVMFFVAGGFVLWLGAGWFSATLCWLFVISRAVHAFIHLTSNHVINRFKAYGAGAAVLAILWVSVGVRLVLTGFA